MTASPSSCRRHRRRRPDRLQPAVPHRHRRPARPRPAGHPAAARDHPRARGLAGRGHGAGRLRLPTAARVVISDDANEAFGDVNFALLVGARPRSKGMERKDLLEANGAIFTVQGNALSDNAAPDIRVLVVGNPANTNALIAMHNAPELPPERFSAMTRLDQNRAKAQLAAKAGGPVTDVTNMTIWGNHSATQYPDVYRARIGGRPAAEVIADDAWVEKEFIPAVQQRGAAIIEARGASSAASAASAAIDHVHDWCSAPRPASGCPWASPPTAPTACRRG